MIGVNLAGAEFGRNRGIYGTDYIYPNAAELDYYHSRGVDLIRLPFTWERMQPTLGQGLDPAELNRMIAFLDAAAQRGMSVAIDLHNFGRYDGHPIGSASVSIAAFQDFWTRLADAIGGHPAIWGFGLMNEPHDMGSAQVWPAAAQAAIDGIRSVGATEAIVVAGDGWGGAHSWMALNGNLILDDPANNLIYEAHVYFDSGNQGTYDHSYDLEGAYPMIGVDRVQPFLDWLQQNNLRGFIGEYGVPDNDPRWLTVLENFLGELGENDIASAYWAGGPWWGNYPLAIEPRHGIDRPQMDVLEDYVAFGDIAPLGDIVWQHSDGTIATADHHLGTVSPGWQVAATGDFDADGDSDILWRDPDGTVVTWEMDGGQHRASHDVAFASAGWEIVNAGDFDADGDSDVLWRHRDGAVVTWEMENGQFVTNHNIAFASTGWRIDGLGDFDADGDSDIIWRHRDGAVVTWEMENGAYVVNHNIAFASTAWQVQGTGDFDGDGDGDILWRHQDGAVVIWEMQNGRFVTNHNIADAATTWQIAGTWDFDSDGDADILWRHADGIVVTWEMRHGELLQTHDFGVTTNAWQIMRTGEFDLA
jgi:endoglucanase